MFKYFKGSVAVTVIGIILAALLGFKEGGLSGALQFGLIVTVLGVLETSLSFDNAVLNARVLADMDDRWRHRFLTWGMAIAVFGMRIVFPLAIVAIIAHLNPVEVITLAIGRPDEYARILASSHHEISAFGGAFLMLVFLKFMVDAEKDHHWLAVIERPLTRLGRMEAVQIAITLMVILLASTAIGSDERLSFMVSGVWGIVAYVLADGIGGFLGEDEDGDGTAGAATVVKSGVAGFLYLELLDASMSFDGVIGAFALSTNIFIIAIGLGIGAMFVRSLTLYLVDKGTLSEFRYLEHGAFWAIGALAIIMFLSVYVEVPEVVTGLIGAFAIGTALVSSIRANRRDALDGSPSDNEAAPSA